jgi:hypothetical protein
MPIIELSLLVVFVAAMNIGNIIDKRRLRSGA